MRPQELIPAPIGLQYKLWKRDRSDKKAGIWDRFAQPGDKKLELPHRLSLTQPIRKSHLFENKIHNIQLATQRISKVMIFPGQVFSFWKIVGKPDKENGYKKGRNLINGSLKEDYGGGLCQVSGIIHHLALIATLPIYERHNHSIDIYAEENRFCPLGADATVVFGYKDLRIGNDSGQPLQFDFEVKTDSLTCILNSEKEIEEGNIEFIRKPNQEGEEVETLRNGVRIGKTAFYRKP